MFISQHNKTKFFITINILQNNHWEQSFPSQNENNLDESNVFTIGNEPFNAFINNRQNGSDDDDVMVVEPDDASIIIIDDDDDESDYDRKEFIDIMSLSQYKE